ncbi:MAG: hypothetical protein E7466_06995 [Ruminococcaceae bacterium]|nr:hypothetical protein [Oscillospiraceae bacterium]
MDKYAHILQDALQEEASDLVFSVVLLFLIVAVAWIAMIAYAWKVKNQDSERYYSQWEIRIRRRGWLGCLGLTLLCSGLGVVFSIGRWNTIAEIRQDLIDESYIVYEGKGDIRGDTINSRYSVDDGWLTVDLDGDKYAFLDMDVFSCSKGEFQGRLVYGENSLIVVDISIDGE